LGARHIRECRGELAANIGTGKLEVFQGLRAGWRRGIVVGAAITAEHMPNTTGVIVAFVLIFASGLEWFGSASAAIDRPRVRSETSEHDAADEQIKENDHRTAVDGHPKFNPRFF